MITETEDYLGRAYKALIKLRRDTRVEISILSPNFVESPYQVWLATRDDLCQCQCKATDSNLRTAMARSQMRATRMRRTAPGEIWKIRTPGK